jgi:hypothetical protein
MFSGTAQVSHQVCHFFCQFPAEGFHASPVCHSGKSSVWMKTSMEYWWNDTDIEKRKNTEKNLHYATLFTPNLTRAGSLAEFTLTYI